MELFFRELHKLLWFYLDPVSVGREGKVLFHVGFQYLLRQMSPNIANVKVLHKPFDPQILLDTIKDLSR